MLLVWLGLGCTPWGSVSMANDLLDICRDHTFVTIGRLYEACGAPGACGRKMACEGRTALIKGRIDYGNVFEKSEYPQVPYQKFLMIDDEGRGSLDVFVESDHAVKIFRSIRAWSGRPDRPVRVRGVLQGFDMPVMGQCRRGLKLVLTGEGSVTLDPAS